MMQSDEAGPAREPNHRFDQRFAVLPRLGPNDDDDEDDEDDDENEEDEEEEGGVVFD